MKGCPPSQRLPALPPALTSVAWSFMNSQSLTQAERRACIAAGSKLRSRPRLGQSGPLNGQHYSIRRDYSTPAAERPPDAKSSRNPLQTKGISRSTSDPCRTSAGPLPKQHACNILLRGNGPSYGRTPIPGALGPLAPANLAFMMAPASRPSSPGVRMAARKDRPATPQSAVDP